MYSTFDMRLCGNVIDYKKQFTCLASSSRYLYCFPTGQYHAVKNEHHRSRNDVHFVEPSAVYKRSSDSIAHVVRLAQQ
jgi:hypothetical protein